MLRDKKAVIFDMDGSLVDSMWIWPEVDRIYMEKYGLEQPEDFHKAIEGKSYTETAQYFVDTFRTLDRTVEEVKAEWQEMTMELYRTKVFPKPGAMEFLYDMKHSGVLLGIATSNNRTLAEAALRARGMMGYFDSVRTSCEVSAGKAAPRVYLQGGGERPGGGGSGVSPAEKGVPPASLTVMDCAQGKLWRMWSRYVLTEGTSASFNPRSLM